MGNKYLGLDSHWHNVCSEPTAMNKISKKLSGYISESKVSQVPGERKVYTKKLLIALGIV
jgi:hypothetical protein